MKKLAVSLLIVIVFLSGTALYFLIFTDSRQIPNDSAWLAFEGSIAQTSVLLNPRPVEEEATREPSVTPSDPEVTLNKPSVAPNDPEATPNKPSITPSDPGITLNKPSVAPNDPEATPNKPSVTSSDPEVTVNHSAIPSDPCCSDKPVLSLTAEEQKIQGELRFLLEEYSHKHKVWREAFLQGNNSVKTLTWIHADGYGGIGDRVQGITFTLALAILSDSLLFLEWTNDPFQENFQKHLFAPKPGAIDWDVDAKLAQKLGSLNPKIVEVGAPNFLQSHTDLANSLKQHIIDPVSTHVEIWTNLDLFSEFMRVMSIVELKQMVNGREDKIKFLTHSTQYNEQVGSAMSRYLLRYSYSLVEKASKTLKELSIAEGQPYTAVHVRTGDFGSLNEGFGGTATDPSLWKLILDCAVNRSHEIIGPSAPVVLLTDSPELKDWTSKNFEGQAKPYPGQPKHMDKTKMTQIEEIAMGSELVVMSRASVLVRTMASGFSETAMRMCPYDKEHLFTKELCQALLSPVLHR